MRGIAETLKRQQKKTIPTRRSDGRPFVGESGDSPKGGTQKTTKRNGPIAISLGERGRASVTDPRRQGFGTRDGLIFPDDRGRFQYKSLNYNQLRYMTISEQISVVIRASSELSGYVGICQEAIAPSYTIASPMQNDEAVNIAKMWIDERLGGEAMLLDLAKQLAYYSTTEGATAVEISNDTHGYPSQISAVSPLSLAFDYKEDDEGEYYTIGQFIVRKNEFRELYDSRTPSQGHSRFFRYIRTNVAGPEVYGYSQVEPVIFPITALKTLIQTIVDFTKGQVFPKHIYSVDLEHLSEFGYTKEDIDNARTVATQLLEGQLSAADITQDIVLDVPIVATLIGAMDRANISGVEMIKDILEVNINRQFRVPSFLFGIQRRSGGLFNDKESTLTYLSFRRGMGTKRNAINSLLTYGLNLVLMGLGLPPEVQVILDDSDTEEKVAEAEYVKIAGEAIGHLVEKGIISIMEGRERLIAGTLDFSELPAELPEAIEPIGDPDG